MGGLSAVLGGAAAGFTQAAQEDRERQFRSEEHRRAQLGDFLGKLANDETAHPHSRQAAIQEMLALQQAPFGKPYKFDIDRIIAPYEPQQTLASQGPTQSPSAQLTIPPLPPGMEGAVPGSGSASTVNLPTTPQQGATLIKPERPAGIFKSPDEITQERASRAGEVAKAQAGQTMASTQVQEQPGGGYGAIPISHAGTAMGPAIPNIVPPQMFSSRNRHPIVYTDPTTGMPMPGVQDMISKIVYDQNDQPVPNAQVFSAAMVPKTTSSSTTTPGGLTTKKSQTTTPQPRGAGVGKGAAKEEGLRPKGASLLGVQPPPAVEAEMDNITMNGVPRGKLNDAQALAIKALKQQGIVPVPSAGEKARGQADIAREIRPLIQHARELIRQDPNAIGPLAGRWSELTQKAGSLKGAPKELAGTLTSIYSLAGGLHGWRSMRVADEFRKAYGDLSNTPDSLASGLNAMQGTVDAIEKIGYPGMDKTAPSGYVRIRDSQGGMHDLPADKIDAAKQRDPGLQVIH